MVVIQLSLLISQILWIGVRQIAQFPFRPVPFSPDSVFAQFTQHQSSVQNVFQFCEDIRHIKSNNKQVSYGIYVLVCKRRGRITDLKSTK